MLEIPQKIGHTARLTQKLSTSCSMGSPKMEWFYLQMASFFQAIAYGIAALTGHSAATENKRTAPPFEAIG
ncbi:hypothetical protein [Laspinema olomoucense]|uniref:hypothetical protein n=1 Tax=Laspinema olomoucense TaxID=3231600 RepID=UPI0021BA3FD3|nr:hypothetical protein [Laspinema sp. D3d]MCT7975659.1 hypothetical protein [Laspinema sp. D3d]